MKNILSSSIATHPSVRLSRASSYEQSEPLFLQSLQEQQQQEGPDDPNPNPNPAGSGDINSQQQQQQGQQQQQQEPQFVSPFKDVDLEMLPDATKEAIKKAEQDLQRTQKEALTARKFQSTHDQQVAEINRLRDEIARAQQPSGQQQQQQQQQKAPTTFEMLKAQYKQNGMPDDLCDKMAKVNAPIFDQQRELTIAQVQQQMGPLAGMVLNDQAASAFETIRQQDKLGWSAIPEVAQKTWDAIQANAAQGMQVTPALAANLSRIFFTEHVEEHGFPTTNGQQPLPQQHQQPPFQLPHMSNTIQPQPQHQSTRFTYPGSGAMPMRQQVQQTASIDPETQAAMAATVANWIVKPKAFK